MEYHDNLGFITFKCVFLKKNSLLTKKSCFNASIPT